MSDFTTEYILESVARCINAIYLFSASQDDKPPALPFPSNPIAPSSMSARYAFLWNNIAITMILSHGNYSPSSNYIPFRYNMGAKCAEHCLLLGYANKTTQLGYQTFLYGTENELRNILMFLVDKLPKGIFSFLYKPMAIIQKASVSFYTI